MGELGSTEADQGTHLKYLACVIYEANTIDVDQVGDYGRIDKSTGEFEKEGNIYDEARFADILASHPPVKEPPGSGVVLCSENVKKLKGGAGFTT